MTQPDSRWDDAVRRRALDRERKRLIAEQKRRMGGEHKFQHIRNAILKRARKAQQ